MYLKISAYLPAVYFLILFQAPVNGQAFGFGCLGFVGGYGGYSYQKYNPTGLNKYVDEFNLDHKDSLTSPMGKFGAASGYRVGLNFFRANIKGFILTTKGFYQYLNEKNSTTINSSAGNTNTIFEVDFRNYGLGIDLGTSITSALSWKVIDAAILYNSVSFTDTRNFPGPTTVVMKYDNAKDILGYTIGTGFILEIIEQYISLEGAAAYTNFTVDRMNSGSGQMPASEYSQQAMSNFVESGGFNAVLQLNIGFPL